MPVPSFVLRPSSFVVVVVLEWSLQLTIVEDEGEDEGECIVCSLQSSTFPINLPEQRGGR